VPKPFSTLQVAYAEPRWVDRDADRDGLDRAARALERELNELVARCEAALQDAPRAPVETVP
jgi:lysophospholipid acyltransferase (LPLAT)-like uncharacterized protein